MAYAAAMPDYTKLAEHLAACSTPSLTLTFEEVEAISGGPLPLMARVHRLWWRSVVGGKNHAFAWRSVGRHVDAVDAYAGTVSFTRDGPHDTEDRG